MEAPQRNLALDLVRTTEAAALASERWLGKGEKEAGDEAAVSAMRLSFKAIDIDGTVVIGEGEKDNAPMLYKEEMLCRLDPQKSAEKKALAESGVDLDRILDVNTLVTSDDVFFAATGISRRRG